jgi:hypothetical protein
MTSVPVVFNKINWNGKGEGYGFFSKNALRPVRKTIGSPNHKYVQYGHLMTLCLDCKKKEEAHPAYERARKAEQDAVRRGDRNFPGIGLPPDLR